VTPIKPEERPKLIALLAAVFVVFGYGAWQLFKPSGAGQPAPAAGTRVAERPPAGGPPQKFSRPTGGLKPATKDIFWSPAEATPKRQPKTLPKAPARRALVRKDDRPTDDRPTAGAHPTTDRKKVAESDVEAPPKQVPPAPVVPQKRLELVGVVSGTPAVAMILVNGREFFVRQGERLDRYHVAHIVMDKVLLTGQNSRIVLRVGAPVGGGSPAAAAAAAAAGAGAPVPVAAPAT
jgi:hypothetical protein